jgi:RNA-directed DNA polymerase
VTCTLFLPAISNDALNKRSGEVRRWRLHRWTGLSLAEVAQRIHPIVRGWMQSHGRGLPHRAGSLLQRSNTYLVRWLRNKHKRLRPISRAMAAGGESPTSSPDCSPTGPGRRRRGVTMTRAR